MTRARASLLLPLLAACTFQPDPVSARGDGAPAGRDRDAAGSGDDGPANEADAEPDAGRVLFGTPEPVSELSTAGDEDDVTLRADLLEIFFDRDGDLFSATRGGTQDPWQGVGVIGALSSTSPDGTPEVAGNGRTIFFSSSRTGGQGGADIWSSTRFSVVSGWDTPVVQTDLNSSGSDYAPVPSDDLLHVTFGSTRDGTNDLFTSNRADPGAAWDRRPR